MRWWLAAWGALAALQEPPSPAAGVVPAAGSLCGGTTVRLHALGRGHLAGDLQVSLGPAPCELTAPANCTDAGCDVTCVTSGIAAAADTRVDVTVQSGVEPPTKVGEFTYAAALTPVVSDFGPSAGQGGDMVHLVGTNLGGASVSVGGIALTKRFGGDLLVQAVVPRMPPGELPVKVWTQNGYACPSETTPPLSFRAITSVQSVEGPRRGSLGGGGDLVVVGQGLDGGNVTLCGAACHVTEIVPEPKEIHAGEDYQALHCTPAAFKHERGAASAPVSPDVTCDLHLVTKGGQASIFPQAWTYAQELTPTVRSVAAADGLLTVNGAGFGHGSDATVTLKGAPCATTLVRDDYLQCTLPAPNAEGAVEVFIAGKGYAVPTHPGAHVLVLPTPPPHIPVETFSAFTSTLCRQATVSTDCPPGWACCATRNLNAALGRCAATCAQGSFLSRTVQAELYPTPLPR